MLNNIAQIASGFILIILGLFLLFMLAFNGTVGEKFVDFSLFTSGSLIIGLGIAKIVKTKSKYVLPLGSLCIVFYLPMIWQQFQFGNGIELSDLGFDFCVIFVVLIAMLLKPRTEMP